jgi:hypothetical protein
MGLSLDKALLNAIESIINMQAQLVTRTREPLIRGADKNQSDGAKRYYRTK